MKGHSFISDALSWISEVVWPSHSAMWRVIEIGVEYVVSMVTTPPLKEGILCQHCLSRPSKCLQLCEAKASLAHLAFMFLDQSHANVTLSSISSTQLSLDLIVKCPWQPVIVNKTFGFLFVWCEQCQNQTTKPAAFLMQLSELNLELEVNTFTLFSWYLVINIFLIDVMQCRIFK